MKKKILEQTWNWNYVLNIFNNSFNIKSLDRSVTVNNIHYPEISHYVPNGYVSDNQKFLTTSLRTISKLRFCDGKNFQYKCADGILNVESELNKGTKFIIQIPYEQRD